jgi:hypothetical protein
MLPQNGFDDLAGACPVTPSFNFPAHDVMHYSRASILDRIGIHYK